MKKFLALGFGCLLTQGAMAQDSVPPAAAKSLPALPTGCADQIANNGLYCSSNVVAGDRITVTFAAIVSKETFPTVDSVLARYTNFARWPEFAAASPQKVIEFKTGGSLALDPLATGELRDSYAYSLKVQGIPLLKQDVVGLSYNTLLDTPYAGALASLEFRAITDGSDADFTGTAKGVKSQVGSIHAVACDAAVLDVCDETKMLLVYTTTVQPDISLAMTIAANTISAGIEDLLVGMLDESIVDELAPPAKPTTEAAQ